MKKVMSTILMLLILTFAVSSFAGQDELCAGFEEGYKSITGNLAIVPVCPVAPVSPVNSTDFREGIKAGIRAASR